MYHSIQANWWSSICGRTLQKRWSIFVKRELVGKIDGFDGIFKSAQTWSAGGHSKNTWFIDSYEAPHLAQTMSSCIPFARRFFLSAIHHAWHQLPKEIIYLRWAPYFPAERFQYINCGSKHYWCFFFFWVNSFYLVSWFDCIFSILFEVTSISIHHLSSTRWYKIGHVGYNLNPL